MAGLADNSLPSKAGGGARKCLGILGTGDYARALAKRLVFSGYDVIMGSRVPKSRQLAVFDSCLCGVRVVSLDECIAQCDTLVAAIHMENFQTTLAPRAEHFAGKVVIDVSNRSNRYSAVSNAEFLQSLLPAASVVKAFNSVSAYAMEDQTTVSTNRVFVGSDDHAAREKVMDLARDLGFAPCDMGGLASARSMEAFVLKVFPGWKIPLFFTFGVFNLWALYCVYIYFIEKTAYSWEQVFLKVSNKPLCMTAITVLALTYLAGSVAGVVQLWRGTKYQRFPRWLALWLSSRRQLGLIALSLVAVHAVASCLMLSPTYYSSWFHKPSVVVPPGNGSQQMALKLEPAWMVWKGELACLFGVVSLLLLLFVGIASLPSVSAALNWAEWRFIQSKVGIFALALALAHVVAMGAPGWAKGGWSKAFRSITLLSGFLPAVTVLLRVVMATPCVARPLKKIRRGWERRPRGSSDAGSDVGPGGSGGGRCAPRRGNLKSSSAYPGPRLTSTNPVYTAIGGGVGGGDDGCSMCHSGSNGDANSSLPTRQCDCSVV